MQILKRIRKRTEAALFQKAAQPKLDLRRSANRVRTIVLLRNRIGLAILLNQPVDLGIRDLAHASHQIANAISIDAVPKLRLRRNLIAFRNRNLAHVIAKARHLQILRLMPTRSSARPRSNLRNRLRILPVANDNLASQPT
jgi:hypothetical protein